MRLGFFYCQETPVGIDADPDPSRRSTHRIRRRPSLSSQKVLSVVAFLSSIHPEQKDWKPGAQDGLLPVELTDQAVL
jgi:hypothetical protein